MKLRPFEYETPAEQIASAYKAASRVETLPKEDVPEAAPEVINDILETTGIIDSTPLNSADPNAKFKSFLQEKGGSLEDVAQQIVNIMCRGESESSRLRAAEFIAKIQGVQVELEEAVKSPKDITINIIGSDTKNLITFMMPKS